eukprot:37806-Eustigmatos_ZCMA.PRE.1
MAQVRGPAAPGHGPERALLVLHPARSQHGRLAQGLQRRITGSWCHGRHRRTLPGRFQELEGHPDQTCCPDGPCLPAPCTLLPLAAPSMSHL